MSTRYMKHLQPARHKWTPPAANSTAGNSSHSGWKPQSSKRH